MNRVNRTYPVWPAMSGSTSSGRGLNCAVDVMGHNGLTCTAAR
jgi:hypothetical protein